MKQLFIFCIISLLLSVTACIEDGFTTDPADQPLFSVDTLKIGTVFTDQPTTTKRFLVHNPHSKQLSIANISVSGPAADCFRLNVDGQSGKTFAGIDIRGKDSVFVLVEATFPPGQKPQTLYEASIDFTVNGITTGVPVIAVGQNVKRLDAVTLNTDTRFTAELPYQVFDSLVVAPGATLTIEPGTTICFHDGAFMAVRGQILSQGTVEKPVTFAGDRTGNVVTDISFDIMSRQWTGLFITPTSTGNEISHTDIKNTWQGLTIEGNGASENQTPQLRLLNCRLRNSGGMVLEAYHSYIEAAGCEFAEAADGLVYLQGGKAEFFNSTFANYYLFSALGGPAVQFAHIDSDSDDQSGLPLLSARFSNCIVYGNGSDLSHGDLTGTDVFFNRCLLKSKGADDDNFLECLWDSDPLFYTVREEYIFDYRLRPDSPAIDAAYSGLMPSWALVDRYGVQRRAALGAYEYVAPAE